MFAEAGKCGDGWRRQARATLAWLQTENDGQATGGAEQEAGQKDPVAGPEYGAGTGGREGG